MEQKVFHFQLDKDEKKNGKAIYNLILSLKAKAPKALEIEPLEEPKYSGKIRGIILSGSSKDINFAGEKIIKLLQEKKIEYAEDGVTKHAAESVEEGKELSGKDRTLERELKSGIAFYHLGLYDDAIEQIARVLKKDHDNYLALQHLGLLCEQKEDFEGAVAAYKKSLGVKDDVSSTRFFMGNVLQKLGNYEEAIEEYKKAIRLDPEIPILYNNLAWAFYQTGDYDRAIRSFEEAINLDPDLPFPYNGLGCVYQEMDYLEDAVEEFLQAIELFPEYSAVHLKLGWVYYQMGDYDKAALEFNTIIDGAEDENYLLSAHYSLANTFMAQNLMEEAYEEFLQVIKLDPEFADAYFHLGVICSKLEMYEKAIDYLNKSMEKNSKLKEQTHIYLALSYANLKKFDEALKESDIALKAEPNDPEVHNILGSIYSYMRKWDDAINHFKKAVSLNVNSAKTSFNLAVAHENNEDYENAVKYYKNTISIDQKFLEAYTNLGWLYMDNDKNDEALVLFERAIELKNDDPELLNNLGWAYSKVKEYALAVEQYKKALKINPRSAVICNNLGIVIYQMGNLDEAYKYFQQALSLDESKEVEGFVHFYMGLIYIKQDKLKEAVDELQLAKKMDKNNTELYYYLGLCYEKLSQIHKSYKYWDIYMEVDPEGKFADEVKEKLKSKAQEQQK